jgi:hypothetical protein
LEAAVSKKKLYSRKEFEELRRKSAREMMADKELVKDALDVEVRAGKYYWVHQTNWFGEPILQLPMDMFALQGRRGPTTSSSAGSPGAARSFFTRPSWRFSAESA